MSKIADARKLTWTLEFKDEASKGIKKADSAMDNFSKKAKKLSGGMQKAGKSLSKWVTAPLTGVGAASMKTVASFDDGMSRVRSISGATGKEFEDLRNKAIELGQNTAYSASEASEGMQILAASGMEANDIMKTSGDMFTLMSAGGTDAETAASVLTNTMSQFNLTADESGRIIDVFSQGAASAKVGVEDLEYALGIAGASMANMNMDVEQSVAMVGQLANAGVPVQQVGTMINAMSNDIKANAGEFKKQGIEVYDSAGKMRDMGAIMSDLEGKLGGLNNEQKDNIMATLFSGQAQRGANAFLQEGSAAYNELTNEMRGAEGAALDMAETNEDNIGGAMRSLGSSLETLMIKVGDVLKEPVKEIAAFVTEVADKFSGLDKETQEMIVKFGAIAAAIGPALFAGGKIISGAQKVGKGFSFIKDKASDVSFAFKALKGGAATFGEALTFIMSPAGWVILAIGAMVVVGVLLYKNWDKIKEKAAELKERVTEAWSNLKEAVSSRIEAIGEKWNELKTRMSEAITGKIEAVKDKFDSIVSGAKEGWNNLKDTLKDKASGVVDAVKDAFSSKVSEAKTAWGELKSRLGETAKGTVTAIADKFHSAVDAVREKWRKLKEFMRNPIKGTVGLVQKGAGWVKGKVTGSHRTGKDRIPYNGYVGELHKDEMVLTKKTADQFRALGGTKDRVPAPQVVTKEVSPRGNKVDNISVNPTISITVEGNADEGTVRDISREVQRAVNQELNKVFTKLSLQGV